MKYLTNTIPDALRNYRITPDNKEENRRYLLQHLTATLLFEYDYQSQTAVFDPFYKDYIGFDITRIGKNNLDGLIQATYLPIGRP